MGYLNNIELNNDLKFLIACCQTEPSEDDKKFILSHLSQVTNYECPVGKYPWATLITTAAQHGILPLVYKTLKKRYADHLPEQLLVDLKSSYTQIAQRNILMSAELIRIVKLLENNDIKTLAFKGPTLAQMVFGDITLRQFGDLDFLIKKKDLQKVTKLFRDQGYKPLLELTKVQENTWYKYAKDMSFIHPKKGLHVEMHWLLLDNDYPLQVDLDAIWEQPQDVNLNGRQIQTFSTESLLIYLCIHGSKHLWERIGWVKDIDQMIRTQTIDWNRIIPELKKSGFERMVFLGLYLSQKLFQTHLPDSIKEALQKEKNLPKLTCFVLSNWEDPKNMFLNTAAMLRLFPSVKMKILYLHKIILKPSNSEYRFIDLSKGFYWVYYFVRPYLLLKKYLTKD